MARSMIQVKGIKEFQAALRDMDRDLPKKLRVAMNTAGELVVGYARPRVPSRSGRARGSLRVRSTQREARVAAGGARVAYYPWLDFGGRVGPARSVRRPFLTEGRYVYPGLRANRDEIQAELERALTELARGAGLEVT